MQCVTGAQLGGAIYRKAPHGKQKQHANFTALQGLTHSGDTRLDNRSEVLSGKEKKKDNQCAQNAQVHKTLDSATKQIHYTELHLANCSGGAKTFEHPPLSANQLIRQFVGSARPH